MIVTLQQFTQRVRRQHDTLDNNSIVPNLPIISYPFLALSCNNQVAARIGVNFPKTHKMKRNLLLYNSTNKSFDMHATAIAALHGGIETQMLEQAKVMM